MSENAERTIDLISFPKKSFWRLSLPIMFFVIFIAVYNNIDLYLVSQLNKEAFYAVSLSVPVFALLCSVGDTLGQGTNSLMSRSIGADAYENAYNTIFHGLLLCFLTWFLVILSIFFLKDFLLLLRLNSSLNAVMAYMVPLFLGSISFILPNFFCETMQSEGDSKRPTIIIISGCILNLILDYIFIFSFNMGLVGAAYATIVSSTISFLVFFYFYFANKTKVPLNLKYFELSPHIIFEILKVSIPNLFDDSIYCISAVFVYSVLAQGMGEMGIIIYATSYNIQMLLLTPVKAYGRGLRSVSAHLFGSRNIDGIKDIYHYVLKWSIATILIIFLFFFLFRNNIYHFFSIYNMEMSIVYIAVFGIVIILSATVAMISSKIFDGFGKSYFTLMFSSFFLGSRILLIYLISEMFPKGFSVLISITVTEVIFALVCYIFVNDLLKRFKRKKDELVVI